MCVHVSVYMGTCVYVCLCLPDPYQVIILSAQAGKKAQLVKVSAAKMGNLSLIPGTHTRQELSSASCLLTSIWYPTTHMHAHKISQPISVKII